MVDEVKSQSVIDKESKCIVLFTAVWCGPCQAIKPTFEALSTDIKGLKFFKVDVDTCQDIAQKYGVTAMPTFIVMQNGSAIDELKGASAAALRNLCQKHKGASTFIGKGRSLNGGPSSIKKSNDIQLPKSLKTVLAFCMPFLVYSLIMVVLKALKIV